MNLNPGDVVVATWGATKGRPGLVLWVDDERGEVCVAALTTKTDYVAAIKTSCARFPTVATWATVQPAPTQPYHARVVDRVPLGETRRIAAQIAKNLALDPST